MMQEYHADGTDTGRAGTREPSRRKMVGKIAHRALALLLTISFVVGLMPAAWAAADGVTVTGGNLMNSIDDTGNSLGYTYIIEATDDEISVEFTDENFLDTSSAPLCQINEDYETIEVKKYSFSGSNTVAFSLNGLQTATPAAVAGYLSGKSDFVFSGIDFYIVYVYTQDQEIFTANFLIYKASASEEPVNADALKSAIDSIPVSGYYTSDDRYNGKDADTITNSQGSFWAEVQSIADEANRVYTSALNGKANQNAVDEQTDKLNQNDPGSALSQALAKCIPTTQVNATGLYETLERHEDAYTGGNPNPSGSSYTDASWENFTTNYENAKELLDSLFYQEGDAIPEGKEAGDATPANTTGRQRDLENAAAVLNAARSDLFLTDYVEILPLWQSAADWLLEQQAKLTAADYTPDSWSAWYNVEDKDENGIGDGAYQVLSALDPSSISTQSAYTAYTQAVAAASTAYYQLEDAGGSVAVHVRVADSFAARYPQYALKDPDSAAFDGTVTLTDDKTIGSLLDAIKFDFTPAESTGNSTVSPCLMAYVNGTLVVDRDASFSRWTGLLINGNGIETGVAAVELHDGDEVVLARVPAPNYKYYTSTIPAAPYETYRSYVSQLEISGGDTMEAEGGAEFSVQVTKTSAVPESGNWGNPLSAGNATIFLSEAKETADEAKAAAAYENTGVVTSSDGTATLSLYKEGWYKLFVADVRDQTPAETTDQTSYTGGEFPGLAAGDSVLLHIVTPSDPASAVATLQKELDAVYNAYEQAFYSEAQWEEITKTYETASAAIASSDLLADAYESQQAAITAIQAVQDANLEENERVNALMTGYLQYLPSAEQVLEGKFYQSDAARMEWAKSLYNGMTEYQKGQLTGLQMAQWNALLSAYGADGSGLPEGPGFTLTIEADHGGKFAACEVNAYARDKENNGTEFITVTEGRDLLETVGTDDQAEFTFGSGKNQDNIIEFQFAIPDGANMQLVSVESSGPQPYSVRERPWDSSGGEAYTYSFLNPRCDFTITINTITEGDLSYSKLTAKNELTEAYNAYSKTAYTAENWSKLTAFYNDGLAAIDAAEDEESIASAKNAAIAAMKTVEEGFLVDETVGELGSVHVIIENTTYSGAPDSLRGTFVDAYVALNHDSTMMSCITAALTREGYGWEGTGGSQGGVNDPGITYISAITYGDDKLEEFDGKNTSGWMGVLNDWFTNEGFASFSASAQQRDYRIVDGDEIRVMFTLEGYGADLGGSWSSSDTSLADLEVDGGTLSPSFDGDVLEYVLVANGSRVSVTPTAANKNYQVKTFLNEKVVERNVDFYRRGESIPVKAGDIIYIGVGEPTWLSMNNQETEAIKYTGTWYTIKVMDSNSAESVVELIDAIPTITYAGYKTQAEAVKLARDAYDALNAEAKTKVTNLNKLTSAEEAIQFYTEIDDVKDLLSKIPSVNKLTTADRGMVQAARNAYDALDEDQKLYITIADVEKFNAAVEWMEEHGSSISGGTIAGVEEMPEEVGETGGGSITITPEASVNSKGEATAKVDAETVEQVLEQAAEDGSISTIVVAPEIDGDTSKVTVELPKSSVSDIAGDSLDLTVSTPIAGMTIPSEGLSELAKQSGSTVSFTAESVTVTGAGGSKSDAIRLDVAVNGKSVDTVPGGLTVTVPAADAGSVLVLVAEDGTETIIRKSVTADGEVAGLVDGPCTVKVVDNAKTFTDTSGHWAADAIDFASSRELFNGTSATAFSPNEEMTRAMLVTVLRRMEDEAETAAENAFANIPDDTWYTDAVIWASENGIVNGVAEGHFDPDANITREQLAAMMYRYADFLGMDTAASGSLSRFHDGSQVSPWASDAMKWAVRNGLISGKSPTILDPKGNATRAEVATILQRMTALMVK